MARQLAALNVDVIEAGFPIASHRRPGSGQEVAHGSPQRAHCGAGRARKEDVSAAIEALKPRLHPPDVFLATSDLHLNVKLKMTREQALEAIGSMIRYGAACGGSGVFRRGCRADGHRFSVRGMTWPWMRARRC